MILISDNMKRFIIILSLFGFSKAFPNPQDAVSLDDIAGNVRGPPWQTV